MLTSINPSFAEARGPRSESATEAFCAWRVHGGDQAEIDVPGRQRFEVLDGGGLRQDGGQLAQVAVGLNAGGFGATLDDAVEVRAGLGAGGISAKSPALRPVTNGRMQFSRR